MFESLEFESKEKVTRKYERREKVIGEAYFNDKDVDWC